MLSVGDFASFFYQIHGHDPFPWQQRLIEQVCSKGNWPAVLDLPTGAGKTAAIDIAVFHLAIEAGRKESRRAPLRIAFVVDRRLIVDDAYDRATKISAALDKAGAGTVLAHVAERLKELAGDTKPLLVRRLRGGVPREDDWARTPSQPTVLCSTVDQVGSRLLFRGYGVSDSMKPVHAGLIGSDCLILLDEAHLAEPFRQTLHWIGAYRAKKWRENEYHGPCGVSILTATPGEESVVVFPLHDEDRAHPVLRRRLEATKIARLIAPTAGAKFEDAGEQVRTEQSDDEELSYRIEMIAREVHRAFAHFANASNGAPAPAIGVVVNRVVRARKVFARIEQDFREDIEQGRLAAPILMIGPARSLDRNSLAESLRSIRTKVWGEGEARALDKPLIIVATQCIEAGVDIDLDALVTEAAPLDALRQRFGRLNRAGRNIASYAAIVAARSDLQANNNDPVYGKAIKYAWECMIEAAAPDGQGKEKSLRVDFGVSAFAVRIPAEALSPRTDAPVLLPAHVDLLSQTAPIPAADPEISLYLHGAERESDSISIVWRGDIDPELRLVEETRRLLSLVPPRSAEAIELPLWAVWRWLKKGRKAVMTALADVAVETPKDDHRKPLPGHGDWIFRWKGNDAPSRWIRAGEIRTGDTIVVPTSYGGVDAFGWNPSYVAQSTDLGREAAIPFAGRRFAIRIAPGLLGDVVKDGALAAALAGAKSQRWKDLREVVRGLRLPDEIRQDLALLDHAKGAPVTSYTDLYGVDDEGRPRGIVLVAPFGIKQQPLEEADDSPSSTEDDIAGSVPGFPLSLREHSLDVELQALTFARGAGFPADRIVDLNLAGFLHDAGKGDCRFQAWLHFDDPLGGDPDEPAQVLAKSTRPLPRNGRTASELPKNWRHEALSVRLVLATAVLDTAKDPELVLWLVGTHHGYGRPFFPHADPADNQMRNVPFVDGRQIELSPGHGPQSLAFAWRGADWAALFERLKRRYGVWELARMEATLRLADHRASESARRRVQGGAS